MYMRYTPADADSVSLVTMADFKYGVNTDVNIGVSVTRGGNTLFEVMGIC